MANAGPNLNGSQVTTVNGHANITVFHYSFRWPPSTR